MTNILCMYQLTNLHIHVNRLFIIYMSGNYNGKESTVWVCVFILSGLGLRND